MLKYTDEPFRICTLGSAFSLAWSMLLSYYVSDVSDFQCVSTNHWDISLDAYIAIIPNPFCCIQTVVFFAYLSQEIFPVWLLLLWDCIVCLYLFSRFQVDIILEFCLSHSFRVSAPDADAFVLTMFNTYHRKR